MTLFGIPAYQAWLLMGLIVFFLDAILTIYRECDQEVLLAASHRGGRVPGPWEPILSTFGVVSLLLCAGPLGIIGLLNPQKWGSSSPLFSIKDDVSSELFSALNTLVVVRNADNQYVREDGSLSFRVRNARIMLLAEAKRSYPDFRAIPLASVMSIHPDYL